MEFREIRYAVADRVLTLTLDRPDKLNAFTERMCGELIAAIDRADADDAVRAIVVTGAGRGFCAGADLSGGGGAFDYGGAAASTAVRRDGGGLVALRLFDCRKPLIAAINGAAVGVGATMTLPMDIRIASSAARFGFVFARRGIVPEACSSWFLPRVVGIGQALEWTYSGRVFDAAEALAGRLVSRVVPPDDLLPTAHALAREIAEHTSAVSIALTRAMMWRMLGAAHPMEAHRIDSRGVQWTGRNADAREGVTSFLDKRPPRFTLSPSTDMPDFYPWWEEPPFE
ncbi:crotonase/enoyl-CoA hydratase family protein [bacterium]|nr:crotonase/enoyl-CoA hydratase family protein [bacterium]